MKSETRDRLRAISRRFYEERAAPFDASRDHPWPGWGRVLEHIGPWLGPRHWRVLDVACGNGRFARFLAEHAGRTLDYTGIDASRSLVETARGELHAIAAAGAIGEWSVERADVLEAADRRPFAALHFDLVVAFGLTHHLPGRASRAATVEWLADRVGPGGWLALTAWQFADRPRFADRLLPWSVLGPEWAIDTDQLEPGDHLLRFQDSADAPRYCHHSSESELADWIRILRDRGFGAPLRFEEDGRSHDLNRYIVACRQPADDSAD